MINQDDITRIDDVMQLKDQETSDVEKTKAKFQKGYIHIKYKYYQYTKNTMRLIITILHYKYI